MMFKFDKKKLLNLEYINKNPSLPSSSEGEKEKLKIKKIILNINKDINGMEITYGITKKKN